MLAEFRNGRSPIMVATDVASRGIGKFLPRASRAHLRRRFTGYSRCRSHTPSACLRRRAALHRHPPRVGNSFFERKLEHTLGFLQEFHCHGTSRGRCCRKQASETLDIDVTFLHERSSCLSLHDAASSLQQEVTSPPRHTALPLQRRYVNTPCATLPRATRGYLADAIQGSPCVHVGCRETPRLQRLPCVQQVVSCPFLAVLPSLQGSARDCRPGATVWLLLTELSFVLSYRRQEHHTRSQLRFPKQRRGLRPPHRSNRSCRRHRYRHHSLHQRELQGGSRPVHRAQRGQPGDSTRAAGDDTLWVCPRISARSSGTGY